mgnify:CR=1 FL=1
MLQYEFVGLMQLNREVSGENLAEGNKKDPFLFDRIFAKINLPGSHLRFPSAKEL